MEKRLEVAVVEKGLDGIIWDRPGIFAEQSTRGGGAHRTKSARVGCFSGGEGPHTSAGQIVCLVVVTM